MNAYIGTATSRVDGRAKVTGAAQYAGEFNVPGLAYGSVVASTIPKGRIARIDTSAALGVGGVIDVLTHETRPTMARTDRRYHDDTAPDGSPFRPLYDDKIKFNGQPIALVVAEDWETARFAASLVRVDYQAEEFTTDLHAQLDEAFAVDKPVKPRGKAEKAYAAAAVRHEAEYFIPIEHHNPMELFAATVVPNGDGKLTVYDKTQGVQNVQRYLCGVFGLKAEDVQVVSPFVGGAFGAGLRPQYEVALAVLAAQALKRPVRLVLTRAQMYGLGYRPATIERVALSTSAGGTLDAITHEAIAMTSQYEEFSRNDTAWADLLYKSPNAKYVHKLARLDVPTPCDMRAPGAATGVYALECAMDELAVALDVDPLELRLRCYSDRDQAKNVPFTSKRLRECYAQGAAAFGWDKRTPEPRSMRDGSELVGWGMATGVWEALQMPMAARIVLTANGHAEVSCATSDIGTGTYTIMAQVAADMLGLPIDNVTVRLGDSTLPHAEVEGGSWTAASVSHAIAAAAEEIRKELLTLAQKIPNSPLAKAKVADVRSCRGVDRQQDGCKPHRIDCRRDAPRRPGSHRAGEIRRIQTGRQAREQHPLGDLRRSEGRRTARRHSRHACRERRCGRADPQRQDGSQPGDGERRVGHRHGAARGDARRPQVRPGHERQYRGIPHAGERRRAGHQGDLCRGAGQHRQSAGHQGRGRDRHCRRGGGHRQRGLSRDRQARPRPADHAR